MKKILDAFFLLCLAVPAGIIGGLDAAVVVAVARVWF